jgi:signal peptidase II
MTLQDTRVESNQPLHTSKSGGMATALQMRKIALFAVIGVVFALDQWTKAIARAALMGRMPRHFGVLTLLFAENRGAFLSLGSNLPPGVRAALFDGLVAVALIAATVVLFRRRRDDIALAVIVGGGAGNLADRIRLGGRVTDFLYLAAGPLHTGVFNVADMAITAGVLWLIVAWAFSEKPPTPSRPADSPSPPNP